LKRVFCLVLFLVAIVMAGCGEKEPDVRNVRWGMSVEEVKSVEDAKFREYENDTLVYDTQLFGITATIQYVFVENQLIIGQIQFIRNIENAEDTFYAQPLADFYTIAEELHQKYGKVDIHEQWRDDEFSAKMQENPLTWGLAILNGSYRLSAKWQTQTTEIIMVVEGTELNGKKAIQHLITYNPTHPKFKKLQSKADITIEPQVEETFDFRQTTWGMTRDEVKAAETAQIAKDDGIGLYYITTVLKQQCMLGYEFYENQLYDAKYLLIDTFSTPGQYITVFDEFVNTIARKYGEPDKSTEWMDELYRDRPEDWGIAIALGHLKLKAQWETETSWIFAHLNGNNSNVNLYVEYYTKDKELLKKIEAARKAIQEDNF